MGSTDLSGRAVCREMEETRQQTRAEESELEGAWRSSRGFVKYRKRRTTGVKGLAQDCPAREWPIASHLTSGSPTGLASYKQNLKWHPSPTLPPGFGDRKPPQGMPGRASSVKHSMCACVCVGGAGGGGWWYLEAAWRKPSSGQTFVADL